MKKRILVLGAGFGGLELCTMLSEAFGDEVEVTLIDKSDAFYFGFSKLDVMFGRATPDAVLLPYKKFLKPGVRFFQETISSIDPIAKRLTTNRRIHEADFLVVALGADYDYAATPGMAEATEFYTLAGATRLGEMLRVFTKGHVLIAVGAGAKRQRTGRASCAPCTFAMNPTVTEEKPGFRPYPRQYETRARFARHLNIFFRPIKPTDADLLRDFFRSHSERTILYRYFTPLHDLPPELVQQFVNLDYHNDMAIVGMVPFEGRERMMCVGRYCRNPAGNDAEIAITVHDQWQRRGIGTFLFKFLTRIARENAITGFTADVMADNHGMLRLIRKCVNNMESTLEAGVYHLWFALDNTTHAAQRHLKSGKKRPVPFLRLSSREIDAERFDLVRPEARGAGQIAPLV